ncbi:ATP-binding protein [Mesorhizobium sp. B2-4-19]|uniref:ATP-binding protein n=1 Tax=Mesorhizobium sp. B2-4-19 TaxID=2589930 RepID=UPI0011292F7C|nr:ATP-binding protein [Mesorhizobium sp. B2-4-19]TPK63695.1 ATP-binding protein [Mesorhizobium sp. B2-4-19]
MGSGLLASGTPIGQDQLQTVSIRPGVSVLSVLRHLNYKPWFALAEFVDNAVQSFLDNRSALAGTAGKLKVAISIDTSSPGRITIRDNAGGIPKSLFPRAFRPAVVPPDRSGLSEFGMGMKSAACWFSSRWHVRTKALGEDVERTVRFDIANIVRDEIEELKIEERPSPLSAHYTEVVLEDLHHIPMGRTLGKMKEHLTDIYRVFMREGILELKLGTDTLSYVEPPVLRAAYYKEPSGKPELWRKEIDFELGGGLSVRGFAALRDPGNYSRSGFALFRRGRLIEGSGEEGYRPTTIFGTGGSSSYARLRLFGEFHLEGFEVSHTKDGFRWDENEEPFLELLREHLDSDDLPLLRQCENYRSLASKKDRIEAAKKALQRTGDVIADTLPEVLPVIADKEPVETSTTPLPDQAMLATRELRFDFRGVPWLVTITLSDDPAEGDWLAISDQGQTMQSGPDTVEIRVSMAHPFMISFAQTDAGDIEPLLRVAAALAISEKLARRAGVKSAGTVRRNMNDLLREALSQP